MSPRTSSLARTGPFALLGLAAALALVGADAPLIPPADPLLLRIAVIGDTGKGFDETCRGDDAPTHTNICAAQHVQLRAHLTGLSPAPDVIVAPGDLVYGDVRGPAGYRKVLRRWWGEWKGAPVLPMRGNHDLSDVESGGQGKVADTLARAFPLPASSPWARVPCGATPDAAGIEDPGRLCYAGERDGICLVVGDSPDPVDIHLPPWPSACTWKIAALHHPPATSFEKKSEIAHVADALAAWAPDVVLAGHAHHLEGLVADTTLGADPVRMLSVVSGAGSQFRRPSAPITLADGTVSAVGVDTTGPSPSGREPTGLHPAYVYADHGYTVVDIYRDHLLLRPIVLRDAGPEAAPCWRWDRVGQALTSVGCGR